MPPTDLNYKGPRLRGRTWLGRLARCATAVVLVGCSTYQVRRARYKTLGDRELIVRGHADEFTVGGRAVFIREDCAAAEPAGSGQQAAVPQSQRCPETILGEGDVIERIDRFHFVVHADDAVKIGRTTRVVPAVAPAPQPNQAP